MGLASIIRGGVATANKITKDLQLPVLHYAWVAQDKFGSPDFASPYAEPTTRRALVDVSRRQQQLEDGRTLITIATLTFLQPFADNGAPNRAEPIDPRDKIVLPDGTSAPIVRISGFEDSSTQRPFFLEVTLGEYLL